MSIAKASNSNSLTKANDKPKFSVAIQSDGYKKLINNTLSDPKRAQKFVANITTAVAMNPDLSDCTPASILSAGLMAETLNLPLNASFGKAYLVPFKQNKKVDGQWVTSKVAQFQIGYRGYIELAIRSGLYAKISAKEVREGEYIGLDPETAEDEVKFIKDPDERETKEIIGYYAYLKLKTGYSKPFYMSKKQMQTHATTYSQAYKSDCEKGTSFSFWTKNFDAMGLKTVLRQLISKWGIMSVEMQNAYESDEAMINEDNTPNYVDNVEEPVFDTTNAQEVEVEEKQFEGKF